MKYWLLTSEYPPFFGGGIGTYCAATARMLSAKGHKVTVFINDASVRDIKVSDENRIRVIRFNTSRTGSSAFLGHITNISYEFAHIVKHFIEKEGKPDCIEAQEYLGIAYYLMQYKLLLSDWCSHVPVLITMHSPSFLYMEYNQVYMYRYPNYWICEMERFCMQAADHIISPSQYILKEMAEKFVLNNKNAEVIPNPFDQLINNMVPLTSLAEKEKEIVFYGKLTPQKGVFRLLAYFRELWDQGFGRTLFLLGGLDIVYHPESLTMGDVIQRKYKAYIDKGLLRLEGQIKPDAIAERLSRAEVVILPSNNDNLPYVVFEMMALGKILLVSRQGGQSEVIEDGVNGFIFDHFETGSFFTQLEKVLELSDQQRKEIAATAIKHVAERYGPEVIYKRKMAVLEKLMSSESSHKRNIYPFIRHQAVEQNSDIKVVRGKLSVVVPYFNMGCFIDETMQSLQQAEYANKVIIIINDGSTDIESIRKLDQYRGQKGTEVIDVKNGGLARARNIGAAHADGEFLAFLDADDTVMSNYYQWAINVLTRYKNLHFIGCWVRYFGNSQNVWPTFMPEPPLILYHNLLNSSSLVYKRSAFLAGGQNDEKMLFPGLEDYESVISMLDHGFAAAVIPETLFNYRIRNDSMIRSVSKNKKLLLFQYIAEKHKGFYGNFACDVLNLLNANGPGIYQDNPTLDHHLADKIPFGGKLSGKLITLIKKNRFAKTIAYKIFKLLRK